MPRQNPPVATQFKPGQSGNPGGKPKTKPLTDRMRDLLETQIGTGDKVLADVIVLQWARMIRKLDSSALKELLNRIEGSVPTKIDADITTHKEDPEFDVFTAALRGYDQRRTAGHDGPLQPSGVGSGIVEGQVDQCPASSVSEREVPPLREGHRENGISTNGHHDATEAREE